MNESASNKEMERLAVLRDYEILGSPDELAYDEIAELAAQVCRCPAAIINFLDDKSVWAKCRMGYRPGARFRVNCLCARRRPVDPIWSLFPT
jgi:hypothetical protein